jgi:hypothetical protein
MVGEIVGVLLPLIAAKGLGVVECFACDGRAIAARQNAVSAFKNIMFGLFWFLVPFLPEVSNQLICEL